MGKNSKPFVKAPNGVDSKVTNVNDAEISKVENLAIPPAPEATPPADSAAGNSNSMLPAPPPEGEMAVPAPKKLSVGFTEKIKTVEFNGVVSETEQDKEQAIRKYILNKLLRQFNVIEVEKVMVSGGKLYFNNNRTALKLPPVKEKTNGEWAETLQDYTARVLPDINKWIARSVQTSSITMEILGSIC
jgi:hypothetical protein